MAIDKSLLSGSTSMLLLSLLGKNEMYGYEMIEALQRQSNQVFSLQAGTLYPLLHGLEERGWVESEQRLAPNGRARKYYRITSRGRGALSDKKSEWRVFAKAVGHVLEGGDQRASVYGG